MKIYDIHILGLDFVAITILPFVLVTVFTMLIIKHAIKLGLIDRPSERKVHKIPTPSLGGIAVVSGICLSSVFFMTGETDVTFLLIIATTLGLSVLGVYDDIKDASPKLRLAIESLMVLILIYFADLSIAPVFSFFGLEIVNPFLDWFLTTVFCVAMINAFNFIDGINGLSGSVFTVNFVCLALGFFYAGYFELGILSSIAAMAIPGFLMFNFFKAKIFLGDSGSIALGYLNVVLVLYLLDHTSSMAIGALNFDSVVFMSLLVLPAVDMIKVVVSRMLNGKSPMQADKTHLHHLILAITNSHIKSTLTIVSYHIVTIIITGVLVNLGINVAFLVIALVTYMILIYAINRVSIDKSTMSKPLIKSIKSETV